jgi:hypothetical protein
MFGRNEAAPRITEGSVMDMLGEAGQDMLGVSAQATRLGHGLQPPKGALNRVARNRAARSRAVRA